MYFLLFFSFLLLFRVILFYIHYGILNIQSVYFATTAASYSLEQDVSPTAANDKFAGFFSMIYVGSQFILFLVSLLLLEFGLSVNWLIILVTLLLSCVLPLFILFLEPVDIPSVENEQSLATRTVATFKVSFNNPRAICVTPISVAYAFTSVFITL